MPDERRTSRGRLSRRGFLAAVGLLGMAGAGAATRGNGYTMPTVLFADAATQRRLGGLHATALTALADTHTIHADRAVYDRSGLLTYPPGTIVRAGGGYPSPQRWTRDAAVNAWNAASLLAPAVGRNTLWSVVEQGPDGLVVQQDDQWWDQVVWIPAAWHHYLITGDRDFLSRAFETSVNTLTTRRARDFDAGHGLFRGPSFMNDGISGYPSPPASQSVHSSFVLDHPGTEALMCLSTNCLYHGAHSALAGMAEALGDQQRAASLRADAARLREAVDRHLWREEAGTYAYFIEGDGRVDTSQEGAGLALALLCKVADRRRASRILDTTHWQPHGIVNVWPHFPRFDDRRPGRHNVMVWPMVHGLYGNAAADAGRTDLFARSVDRLAALVTGSGSGKDFYELYDSVSGDVDGGWQEGGSGRAEHFVSQPDQAWSATAYLRLIHDGLFGLTFTEDALRLRPCLPPQWGAVSLHGLRYRGMTLDITLRGGGHRIQACTVDGRRGAPVVPADETGHHTVDVVLEV
ncbi:MGH1-like glycoside hydrolase domain-containing protein [Streptomyces sp. NBC_00005]|uniref:MGH1-like glycoside hydrolase domain-containing protein n=1 Tax=Streptomyces sp. NBC_00005 TaxID=2903609 RepID=UPI0032450081